MQLPQDLRTAIEAEVAHADGRALSTAASELSALYREGGVAPAMRTREQRLAYTLVRMPATYAATRAALVEVADRLGDTPVRSVLDLGAGPGTVAWAAADVFPDLERITMIERDRELMALGKRLAQSSPDDVVASAAWMNASATEGPLETHDLVIASYVCGEIIEKGQRILTSAMLEAAGLAAVVIEPGTPAGYATVLKARDRLIREGARVIAPCPHSDACPMMGNDWCHFAARVERTALHRRIKGAELSYEDEKYSYVAVTRGEFEPAASRLIRRPLIRHGHVILDLCGGEGLGRTVVAKHDKAHYKLARKAHWGDAWE